MSQDFKINIDADLNTAEAEQKLNALLKEKHKLTSKMDGIRHITEEECAE